MAEKSFHDKILFSGALNPGMSGGPAIDGIGQVVGVNVSTAGNDISFLVPVQFLSVLLDRTDPAGPDASINLHERIEAQLLDNQQKYLSPSNRCGMAPRPAGRCPDPGHRGRHDADLGRHQAGRRGSSL